MADYEEWDQRGSLSRTRLVGTLLEIAGWFGLLATLGWMGWRIWELSQAADTTVAVFVQTIVWTVAGLAASVLLWGVGELLRVLESFQQTYEQAAAQTRPSTSSTPARDTAAAPVTDEITLLLREVRDISLLNEKQRQMRLEAQGRAAVVVLEREVPALLREHNWLEARHRVQEARERFPTVPAWDSFEQQIEQMRNQVEQHDIEGAERQISDLSALGAWDRVAEVVRELLQRHPDSIRTNELAHRIRAQRSKAEAEQRAKLMAQAQESANNRDWRTAMQLAGTIMQRYPRSPEAQALRLQVPTLRENAEIQARQRLEADIRDLVRQHRFVDALRLAHEVIDQYPESPQAEALREQLPKLQEKAAALAR